MDLNNRKIDFNNTIIDKTKVSYIGTEKDKYIDFMKDEKENIEAWQNEQEQNPE